MTVLTTREGRAGGPRPRGISAWLGLAFGATLSLGVVLGVGACFDLPADDVTFRCEGTAADVCPAGYRCEADDCCHRIGSDVASNFGACTLGGGGSGGSGSGTGDESGSGTDTGATTG